MKNSRTLLGFVILGVVLAAGSAMAASVTTVGGSGYGPYQTGQGGEFTLQVSSDLAYILNNGYLEGVTKNVIATANTGNFQTFCLEHNEYIYPNNTVNVTISSAAVSGGVSGAVNGADPISMGTAWLYSQFATGSLAGYTYATGGLSAANLQDAIWMLEGEIAYNASNPFIASMLLTNNWTYDYASSTNASGAFGVGVLNMGAPGQGQDQLVMADVPEPSMLILLGIGLVGVAIAVKKFHFEI